MASSLERALASASQSVELAIEAALRPGCTNIPEAMMYAVKGGKTLRGFLVLEGSRLHGISEKAARPAAGAIEALHAYSLVHDDLPCMDDDDVRRGQPTVHKKWDEATAVLTGDALQALAFELLMYVDASDKAKVALVHLLANFSGEQGMVGGQALDIAAETVEESLSLAAIEDLQAKKTGALIRWACEAGPIIAEADAMPMMRYGQSLGLAFQIADDILDVEGDAETVGKAVGKDTTAGKATFVSHLGLDGAKSRASELVEAACDALSAYGEDADTLREAARFVITRKK